MEEQLVVRCPHCKSIQAIPLSDSPLGYSKRYICLHCGTVFKVTGIHRSTRVVCEGDWLYPKCDVKIPEVM